ncbi:MAG: hypothetical protein C0418_06505 [Coriobacteriaceae bacterium]|nr:hypothetical protein [Coriobacteriaceae bacterium]
MEEARMPEAPYPQYHCPVCGKELPLEDARITVTCSDHAPETDVAFEVREAVPADKRDIEAICDRAWGETEFDSFGVTFDVMSGINLVAEVDGSFAGLLSLAVHGGELAIVLLTVYPESQGSGVGSALLERAVGVATDKHLPFIKVATTNDNIPALYFYQRQGFVISEVARGLAADKHGSAEPGFSDIPVRDEIRLRRPVA